MKRPIVVCFGLALLVAVAPGMTRFAGVWMGRQPDGSFLVSTGQRIEAGSIAFTGRPIDLALHPTKDLFAILNKDSVLLATANGVIKGTEVALGASAGFRGLVWAPDGEWLAASTERGHIQLFRLSGTRLLTAARITITPKGQSGNPVPGGMAISRDESRLFVAAANRNAVVLVDLARKVPVKEYPVQNLPFEPRLSEDESTLIVSNWGGDTFPDPANERPRVRTSISWSMSEARPRRAPSASST
jgi:DNA-binding beta-propeller fold protein YncE